nr:MAG TPA: hypothetical protein [Caudoviricetes sp.]
MRNIATAFSDLSAYKRNVDSFFGSDFFSPLHISHKKDLAIL